MKSSGGSTTGAAVSVVARHASTKAGRNLLRDWFREPLTDKSAIEARQHAARALHDDCEDLPELSDRRAFVQEYLATLHDEPPAPSSVNALVNDVQYFTICDNYLRGFAALAAAGLAAAGSAALAAHGVARAAVAVGAILLVKDVDILRDRRRGGAAAPPRALSLIHISEPTRPY